MLLHSKFRRSHGSERIGVWPVFRSTWRHKQRMPVHWAGWDFLRSLIPCVAYASEVVDALLRGSDSWAPPRPDACRNSSHLQQAHSMWLRSP